MSTSSRARSLSVAALAALALAACATPTAFAPAARPGAQGYAEQQIEPDRYRVSFNGNSVTSREQVENFLLYRAAQLTAERGFDWFAMADRNTERKSRTYIDQPFRTGAFGYWGPQWNYYGRGFGWRAWDPFWGDPFFDRQIDVRQVDRYQASAEIVLGRGSKPAGNVRAFDARAVLQSLGPTIQPPRA